MAYGLSSQVTSHTGQANASGADQVESNTDPIVATGFETSAAASTEPGVDLKGKGKAVVNSGESQDTNADNGESQGTNADTGESQDTDADAGESQGTNVDANSTNDGAPPATATAPSPDWGSFTEESTLR